MSRLMQCWLGNKCKTSSSCKLRQGTLPSAGLSPMPLHRKSERSSFFPSFLLSTLLVLTCHFYTPKQKTDLLAKHASTVSMYRLARILWCGSSCALTSLPLLLNDALYQGDFLFVWTRYCCQYPQVAREYGKLSSLGSSQIRMLSDHFLPHFPKCTADKIQQAVFPWDRIFCSSGYGTVTHSNILRLSTLSDLHRVCTNRL